MLIYGVCISDIQKVDEEKGVCFLKELADAGLGADDYYANFLEDTDNDEYYGFNGWIENFEANGYYGLAAFLQEVISVIEEIDIVCDDPNGVCYLGLSADMPWNFNEKTRSLSEQEYSKILSKYINKIANEDLTIRWWSVNDDCDY